ncbi:hypothetical protein [Tabrizicola sp.]|uniref:hypothetical protein n=1 Tax=Tabrizicola sp. TaxID=2005166 RepID=UPI00286B8EC4|nr:hypothetical protein [Tabrizicola sp.]
MQKASAAALLLPISLDAAQILATACTAAWNSGSSAAVARYCAPTGQIAINGGQPWHDRDGVAAMAGGFFADVPDLNLNPT